MQGGFDKILLFWAGLLMADPAFLFSDISTINMGQQRSIND
jgi:hypothetical protein